MMNLNSLILIGGLFLSANVFAEEVNKTWSVQPVQLLANHSDKSDDRSVMLETYCSSRSKSTVVKPVYSKGGTPPENKSDTRTVVVPAKTAVMNLNLPQYKFSLADQDVNHCIVGVGLDGYGKFDTKSLQACAQKVRQNGQPCNLELHDEGISVTFTVTAQ